MKKYYILIFASISFFADAQKLTVYAFLATECPISQQMTLPLNEIKTTYKDSKISWVAVFTDGKKYKKQIREFTKKYDLNSWKIVHDKKLIVAKKHKATITPEVALVADNKAIIYQGAINNWYYEWGKRRAIITEHYLKSAIESYLKNEKIEQSKSDAIGCWIEF